MKVLYVVAISHKEARELAGEIGHETKEAADEHLKRVKAPPTDPYYAVQYRVYKVSL